MPGNSLMDIAGAATYDLPFIPSIWFCHRYPSIRFSSTQIDWLRIGLFDSLMNIKLVHITLGLGLFTVALFDLLLSALFCSLFSALFRV
jgi:hypothetical protein